MLLEIGARRVGPGQPLFVDRRDRPEPRRVARRCPRDGRGCAAAGRVGREAADALRAATLVAPSCPAPAHVAARSLRRLLPRRSSSTKTRTRPSRARRDARPGVPVDAVRPGRGRHARARRVRCLQDRQRRHHAHGRCSNAWPRTGKPIVISTGMSDTRRHRGRAGDRAAARRRARGAAALRVVVPRAGRQPEPAGDRGPGRAVRGAGRALGPQHRSRWPSSLAVALGACIYEKHFMLHGQDAIDAPCRRRPRSSPRLVRRPNARASRSATAASSAWPPKRRNVVAEPPQRLRRPRPARGRDRRGRRCRRCCARRPGSIPASPPTSSAGRATRDVRAGTPFYPGDLEAACERSCSPCRLTCS